MKIVKHFLAAAGVLMMLAACSTSKDFTIEATVDGLPDGTVMKLTPAATHQQEESVATAVVENGAFKFSVPSESPRIYFLGPEGIFGQFKVLAQTGDKIKVTGKAVLDGERYRFEDIVITGSPLQDEYESKIASRAGLDDLYAAMRVKMDSLSPLRQQAIEAKNDELADEIYQQMVVEEKGFFDTVESITLGIIRDNAQTWWGPMLALDMFSYLTEEQKSLYDGFSDEAKQSYYGQIMKRYVAPESAVGAPLPAFSLAGENGSQTTVSGAAKGKKYVLVDFWASWCAPCRKEIPNLKALYEKYAAKGFEIVSISIDSDKKAWEKALEEEQLPWPNYLDDGSAAKACNVRAVPTMYLLDEKGSVLEENIRGEALAQKLAELLD